MFGWLNIKNFEEKESSFEIEEVKANNYETKENGDIVIKAETGYSYGWISPSKHTEDFVIHKDSIISHTENSIEFKKYRHYFNFESKYFYGFLMQNMYSKPIEKKEDLVKYKETQVKTYTYSKKDKCWKLAKTDVIGREIVSKKTPLKVFKEEYESKYKLIESEEEFNEYITSTLDCDTWCRRKLYNKMKEVGLGDGFINEFADLVGNDLDKYHAMIDLANEVSDKDTLMYLYTYKFRED